SGQSAAAAAAWTELSDRARMVGDAKAEAFALSALALLLEGPLARPLDAERVRIRLCEVAPADVAAAEALVALVTPRGDAKARTSALERLREALRRSFAPPERECEVLRTLAEALGAAGRHQEAVGRLREARALAPGNMQFLRALAQAAGR